MNDATFKRVIRLRGASDTKINAQIEHEWKHGGVLVSITYPAGMIWAVMVFSYPDHEQDR